MGRRTRLEFSLAEVSLRDGEEEKNGKRTSAILGYKASLPLPKGTSNGIWEILLPHLWDHKIPASPWSGLWGLLLHHPPLPAAGHPATAF